MINVDMMNPIENIYADNESTIIDINELPYYEEESYDFNDDKSFKHYMVDLERTIRMSFEYRSLINYLKSTEGMNQCSFLENVVSEPGSKVKIELHHSPLTLYDICMTVLRKRQSKNEDIDINAVAQEVMFLHYIGWVGLIPLSQTVHEMVHNQYVFVPTNLVRGNWRAFVESYHDHIDSATLDAIDSAEKATQQYLMDQRMGVFNNHRIYLNINGSYNLPGKDDKKKVIHNHISELKSGRSNSSKADTSNLVTMCTIVK
jgi:hypothetical protein